MSATVPKSLAGYDVLGEIERGGMGEVLLARRRGARGFERLVAIKTMRSDLPDVGDLRAMFLDEARLLARLHHPAIAQVYDFAEDDGVLYLVMEYVAGASFRHLMRPRASPRVAAQAMAEVCRGLHAAHELADDRGQPLGVVHRDISPPNLMLTFDGRVKILDFGIATMRGREVPVTEYGTIKGKPPYMAPEQLRHEPTDRRTDVFAASVVLHELLTGEQLFHGDSPYTVVHSIMNDEIPAPSSRADGVSAELDAIVLRGLSRAIDGRYPSAAEMADALERVVAAMDGEKLETYAPRALAADRERHDTELRRRIAAFDNGLLVEPSGRPSGVPTGIALASRVERTAPDESTSPSSAVASSPATPARRWKAIAAIAAIASAVAIAVWLAAPAVSDPRSDDASSDASIPRTKEQPSPIAGGGLEAAADPELVPSASGLAGPPPSAPPLSGAPKSPAGSPSAGGPPPPATVADAGVPPVDAFGFITFGAEPFALVQLDGVDIGPTPKFKYKVKTGTHRVSLVSPDTGAVRLSQTVEVTEGETLSVIAK